MDIFDCTTRSKIMSRVKSKNTKPEIKVRKALHAAGLRFRLHRRDLPGTPDLVLPRYRAAVFINGCFWHGHDCSKATLPKSNVLYWEKKIQRNKERDQLSIKKLRELGWKVYIIWECELHKGIELIIEEVGNS